MSQLTTGAAPPMGAIRPTAEDQAALKRALAEKGEPAVCALTLVSRNSIQRAAAGSPIRRGTLLAIRLGLGLIQTLPLDAAGEAVE